MLEDFVVGFLEDFLADVGSGDPEWERERGCPKETNRSEIMMLKAGSFVFK